MSDPALDGDWHPVALSAALPAGARLATRLLGREVVVWRGADGAVHAGEDRCPHRGTRLSVGEVKGDEIVCAYHGWRFDGAGRCTKVPAHPALDTASQARLCARMHHAEERYGLVWVCVGTPAKPVLPFPEHDDPHLRIVHCGPYDVDAAGPRIVENFLDMAHFGWVHGGILGDLDHTEVRDYQVDPFDDGQGGSGVIATQCRFWQPRTNSLAHGGSEVEYTYRVVRPLTAILTKLPEAQAGFREAISLHVQPLEEERSRVFIILAMTNDADSDEALRAFQDTIFGQDLPILENQRPKKLPLAPGAEQSMACDRLSLAYRRLLKESGMRWGVIAE
ncbi:aromatic ring-hydroxylating oxygenase subunit alpha [Derxia gummosa]|uniref:Aromatic ring-hydroxylating oxygenase subunit alpha n=1 Tax=Derxia gummosa DSM 723 TaxID=1121388 RepID=A0A8B6X6B5_9BURK|nr:aromatic ring-hydroxylating dioxygenase subunit alpha [Derxia gummosa]